MLASEGLGSKTALAKLQVLKREFESIESNTRKARQELDSLIDLVLADLVGSIEETEADAVANDEAPDVGAITELRSDPGAPAVIGPPVPSMTLNSLSGNALTEDAPAPLCALDLTPDETNDEIAAPSLHGDADDTLDDIAGDEPADLTDFVSSEIEDNPVEDVTECDEVSPSSETIGSDCSVVFDLSDIGIMDEGITCKTESEADAFSLAEEYDADDLGSTELDGEQDDTQSDIPDANATDLFDPAKDVEVANLTPSPMHQPIDEFEPDAEAIGTPAPLLAGAEPLASDDDANMAMACADETDDHRDESAIATITDAGGSDKALTASITLNAGTGKAKINDDDEVAPAAKIETLTLADAIATSGVEEATDALEAEIAAGDGAHETDDTSDTDRDTDKNADIVDATADNIVTLPIASKDDALDAPQCETLADRSDDTPSPRRRHSRKIVAALGLSAAAAAAAVLLHRPEIADWQHIPQVEDILHRLSELKRYFV